MSDEPGPGSLPDSPAFLGAAVDALDDPFLCFDAEGNLDYWNRAVVDVTGYSDDDLASMTVTDLVSEAKRDAVRAAVAGALDAGRASVAVEFRGRDGDGVAYELGVYAVPHGDDAPGLVAVGHECDEVGEREWEHGSIVGRMTDAFFAVDEDWRLTYVNEQARPILAAAMGRAETDDMQGLHLWEQIPEAAETTFYERYHEAMATQESVAFEEYYGPLDRWFEVRAYPSETGLSVYFRDVTDHHRRREKLIERERVLREIYEVTADGTLTFTERVERLLEIGTDALDIDYGTLSQIHGEDYEFEVVVAPDDSVEAGDVVPLVATNCERTAARERTLVLANVAEDAPDLTDRAGYEDWGIACYLGAPVLVDDVVYGTFCFYDTEPRAAAFSEWEVTLVDLMSQWVSSELDRQQARERLERQNEQLDRFASIVSHDLRNPLNVLLASLETLDEEIDDGSADEHIERSLRAVDRMSAIIEDVLETARSGERIRETEPVELDSLVETVWASVETGEATLDATADATVVADPSRLRQLLANLFRNSVEHGGDDVTVTVASLADGFAVADDGPGVDAAEREKLFEAGYSTTEDGTGFGLSIVARVADAHGWSVAVTESSAGGVQFEFTGVETA